VGVSGFDHVALPTANAERFLAFYRKLGFGIEGEEEWRAGKYPIFAIKFGDNKINVHPEAMVAMRGEPFYLRGPAAEPGCGDICFVWVGGVDALLRQLRDAQVDVIEGPVPRVGGRDTRSAGGVSVYVRDPDENLLEFISYDADDVAGYSARDR
jgi:catechol 2,3-dioxygenase-like lactoylglutathione lyase family enzyme